MVTPTREVIEGKVAKILNDRELVINRGSTDGVQLDTRFKVVEDSEPILDPDTQEPLGSVEREKVRIKVVHVQESLAIGRTYETYRTRGGPFWALGALSQLNWSAPPETRVRTLRSSTGPLDESESLVVIGDKIVELAEQE